MLYGLIIYYIIIFMYYLFQKLMYFQMSSKIEFFHHLMQIEILKYNEHFQVYPLEDNLKVLYHLQQKFYLKIVHFFFFPKKKNKLVLFLIIKLKIKNFKFNLL